jgi:sterol desaturase/sphingolipid hydroxylase (fatty acid hydroxylase superfamily)
MWLSDPFRILALVVGGAVFWSLESLLPLYRYEKPRWRRALPNLALTALLVLTNLALLFVIAGLLRFSTDHKFGLFFLFSMPLWLKGVSGVIAMDLFTYFAHVLMHKSRIGWRFHRVHHSDKEVNVTTAFRQHPGETIWRILWQAMTIAVFGIPMWVVVSYLTISTLNAQLEHTNIKLIEPLDRVLRILFVTPNMHKVHHLREQFQTDTNYGNIFSVWDRVFGSYTSTVEFGNLRYGLEGFDGANKQTLSALLRLPFLRPAKVGSTAKSRHATGSRD